MPGDKVNSADHTDRTDENATNASLKLEMSKERQEITCKLNNAISSLLPLLEGLEREKFNKLQVSWENFRDDLVAYYREEYGSSSNSTLNTGSAWLIETKRWIEEISADTTRRSSR